MMMATITRRTLVAGGLAAGTCSAIGLYPTEASAWHRFSIDHLSGPVAYDGVLAAVLAQVRDLLGEDADRVAREVAGMIWDNKCITVYRSRRPMPMPC